MTADVAPNPDLPLTWGVSTLARVTGWFFTLLLALATLFTLLAVPDLSGDDRIAAIVGVPLGVISTLLIYRRSVYAHVTATEQGVLVANPLRRRLVAWSEIEGVSSGYYGLMIGRRSGWPVTAWAVQQSNLASWRGWQTRSVIIAETLNALVQSRRAPQQSPARPG